MTQYTDLRAWAREIREALAHLYDHAYLETHALAQHLVSQSANSPRTRAQELRRILLDAIEQLNPGEHISRRALERRAYTILFDLYVEGIEASAVADDLGIGLRQLRRDRAVALDALATILSDRYSSPYIENHEVENYDAAGNEARTADLQDSEDSLQLESVRLAQQPEAVEPSSFIQRVISLLDGLASTHHVRLHSTIGPEQPPFETNPTLLRQVLLTMCSHLIAYAPPTEIVFEAAGETDEPAIGMHLYYLEQGAPSTLGRAEELIDSLRSGQEKDFATMLAALGGAVIHEPPVDGELRLWLKLKQPRFRTVLVVDDKEELFALFQRFLISHPYRLVHAGDVDQALASIEQDAPDIVLLDLMMPGKDGWELLQTVRRDPQYDTLPVIVCSVLHEPMLAQALGVQHYIKKPVTASDLLSALATV